MLEKEKPWFVMVILFLTQTQARKKNHGLGDVCDWCGAHDQLTGLDYLPGG